MISSRFSHRQLTLLIRSFAEQTVYSAKTSSEVKIALR
jgi:hypothetical protein